MRRFKHSIWDLFEELTSDKEKWNYYVDNDIQNTAQDLFDNTNALLFIKSAFKKGSKDRALDIVYRDNCEISQYRSNHTLSAYLLGIILRDRLNIDMKELPQIEDRAPTKNFLYFWSLTCLYHDYAFSVEEKSKEFVEHIRDIDDFTKQFNITHSMLDESEFKDLIVNYFNYRIKENGVIDHGIAGAMLFYDGLIKQYIEAMEKEGITKKQSFTHHGLKYSREYKEHILFVANTIAQHNMWRANEFTALQYKNHHLEELIPNSNNTHKISFYDSGKGQKNKLLFLLCLIDTIEPIKCLGRDKNKNPITNPYIVLEKLKISFDKNEKIFSICCPEKYFSDYMNSIRWISDWMDVELVPDENEGLFTISINKPAQQELSVA